MHQVEKMRVDIETVSPLTAGQTVCDIYHMSQLPKNVHVAKVSIKLDQAHTTHVCDLNAAQITD